MSMYGHMDVALRSQTLRGYEAGTSIFVPHIYTVATVLTTVSAGTCWPVGVQG